MDAHATQEGVDERLLRALGSCLDGPSAQATLRLCITMARVDTSALSPADGDRLLACLRRGLQTIVADGHRREACLSELTAVLEASELVPQGPRRIEVPIREEYDIVQARAVGRDVASELGFSSTAQVKIATVISELARNIFAYAQTGTIVMTSLAADRPGIEVVATDRGPGVADIDLVLSGEYRSKTGLGIGLRGSRKLMDEFLVDSRPGEGTTVIARKYRE